MVENKEKEIGKYHKGRGVLTPSEDEEVSQKFREIFQKNIMYT